MMAVWWRWWLRRGACVQHVESARERRTAIARCIYLRNDLDSDLCVARAADACVYTHVCILWSRGCVKRVCECLHICAGVCQCVCSMQLGIFVRAIMHVNCNLYTQWSRGLCAIRLFHMCVICVCVYARWVFFAKNVHLTSHTHAHTLNAIQCVRPRKGRIGGAGYRYRGRHMARAIRVPIYEYINDSGRFKSTPMRSMK